MQTSTSTQPDLDQLDDSQLLKRYVDHRDERAFAELYGRWNQKLLHFISGKIGWDEAEEIVQDAWTQVHRHAHRFEWHRRFSAWLYAIAHNLAKNELRHRSRSPVTLFSTVRAKWTPDDMDRPLQWADKTYAPDKAAQKRELEHRVMEATEQLKPQHRVVFVLREFEGKDYEQIAEITGAKLGTVKSRLSRARTHFRDALLDLGLAAADLDQLDIPQVEVPSEKIIDLNTADLEKLCGLPDVGPGIARKIIEARPFDSAEELAELDWLSPRRVEEIRPHACLSGAKLAQLEEMEASPDDPVELNTADLEELLSLPHIGALRARRIIEARPIENGEQLAELSGFGTAIVDKIRPLVEELPSSEPLNGTKPRKTVRWSKGYNGLSAVHVVSSSDEEGRELSLACGAELPVQEREGVELNPQDDPTCQRCQWALASDEGVAA